MSNARADLLGTSTHFFLYDSGCHGVCGACARYTTTDRAQVTCKRCLASLAKRDREFQRKARRFLEHDRGEFGARLSAFGFGLGWSGFFREQAFRAIAREEGRA